MPNQSKNSLEIKALPYLPLLLSADSPEALVTEALSLMDYLCEGQRNLRDVAFTLATKSKHREYRLALVFEPNLGIDPVIKELYRFVRKGKKSKRLVTGRVLKDPGKVAWLFSGMGSQYPGMGQELYELFPIYRETLDEICGLSEYPLKQIMFEGPEELLGTTIYSQSALLALELGLFRQLKVWDLKPDCLLSHSIGEMIAACAANVFPPKDSLAIIESLITSCDAVDPHCRGSMIAIMTSASEVEAQIKGKEDRLTIAAINGPQACVLSGDTQLAEEVEQYFHNLGKKTTPLVIEHAFHSVLMNPMVPGFRKLIENLDYGPPTIPMISNRDGKFVSPKAMTSPDYWCNLASKTVYFSAGIETLEKVGVTTLVECGPQPVLTAAAASCWPSKPPQLLPLMRKKESPTATLFKSLAILHINGQGPDWSKVLAGQGREIALPTKSPSLPKQDVAPSEKSEQTKDDQTLFQLKDRNVPELLKLIANETDQFGAICQWLRGLISEALNLDDPSEIDFKTGFMDLGLDSVMVVDLHSQVQQDSGLELPTTIVFDYPDISELARYLHNQLKPEPVEATTWEASESQEKSIAIIGTGMRLPGGVVDLASLQQLLTEGRDTTVSIPTDRWDGDAFYDPNPESSGKSYVRYGSFLDRIDLFDAAFFSISPREAKYMDPQHRLLLETSWEALEQARILPSSLGTTQTGVFIGIGPSDYNALLTENSEAEAYAIMGGGTSFSAGRLAYVLGLRGPTIAVDTTCSSSLVALDLAVKSLRQGNCKLAIVGGVQVLADPRPFVLLSRSKALAVDGRSKTFSAKADGYGRGEGVAVVVLKPLDAAMAAGDPIKAIIRGSGVNHDGASGGLTVPNGSAQQQLLRTTLADAGMNPSSIDVIECHGTGTVLGDPIEVGALQAVYGQNRETPLLLGSLKSNIGHLESAAGLAAILKMVAAMTYEQLPASAHATPLNPHINWNLGNVQVNQQTRPWPRSSRPRRAAISAFGLSGTNAHVIIEEATEQTQEDQVSALPFDPPILLSAKTAQALQGQANRLFQFLNEQKDVHLADLSYSLATTRSHFDYRIAITGKMDLVSLRQKLEQLSKGDLHHLYVTEETHVSGKLAMLFTGQGSQYINMGSHLQRFVPMFQESMTQISELFQPYLDRPISTVIPADEAQLKRAQYNQPALFALEVSLYRCLSAWGVQPDILLGHSLGEITAAYVAGIFSLEDAVKLVATRALLLEDIPLDCGSMISITATEEEVTPLLNTEKCCIAAINGPETVVISGDKEEVQAIGHHFQELGRQITELPVSHAFHSHHMHPIRQKLAEALETMEFNVPKIPMVCSLTGKMLGAQQICGPQYWLDHLCNPVQFYKSIQTLEKRGVTILLECGSQPALLASSASCWSSKNPPKLVPCMRQEQPHTLHQALVALHVQGKAINWEAFYRLGKVKAIDLPSYAFMQESYWLEKKRQTQKSTANYTLAGIRIDLPEGNAIHNIEFGPGVQDYLTDHVVYEHIVVPGAMYLAVFLAVAENHWPNQPLLLSSVQFVRALTFKTPKDVINLQVQLQRKNDSSFKATLTSRSENTWITHAIATLGTTSLPEELPNLEVTQRHIGKKISRREGYLEHLSAYHIDWGPKWCWLDGIANREKLSLASLNPPQGICTNDSPLPAGLMDNSFLLGSLEWIEPTHLQKDNTPKLPFTVEKLIWFGNPEQPKFAHGKQKSQTEQTTTLDLCWWNAQGEPLAILEGFTAHRAPSDRFLPKDDTNNLFQLNWKPIETPNFHQLKVLTIDEALANLETGLSGKIAIHWPETEPTHVSAHQALTLLQNWPRSLKQMTWLTRSASNAPSDDSKNSPAHACLWGLARTFRSEHPERQLQLVDNVQHCQNQEITLPLLPEEPELACHREQYFVPQLDPIQNNQDSFHFPKTANWKLEIPKRGSIENLSLEAVEAKPLEANQVRLHIRATGLNFREVLNVLGMYPGDPGPLGMECSGIITELGEKVTDYNVGDRVFGLLVNPGIADARSIAPMPRGMSFADAATLSAAYLTAWHALVDLGELKKGERILIHAASGGVGSAATQLAQYLGATVYATASPAKQAHLKQFGLPQTQIANSRTLNFEQEFMSHTKNQGMDVVLNALAGDFTDASLRLLPRGGRFLEMGKTDLRDPKDIEKENTNLKYLPFDVMLLEPSRMGQILGQLVPLFEKGALKPLPRIDFELTHAKEAFRYMAQAKHIGKIVLRPPARLDFGTVLITGGTGELGQMLAKHLVTAHNTKNLLLISRSGMSGNEAFCESLKALGAENVSIQACNSSEPESIKALLEQIPKAQPLNAVIHLAGVLDDGIIDQMTTERLDRALEPKLDGAWILHQLTQEHEPEAFIMFSSMAGVLGAAGQGNYAAANCFLDALATFRKRLGLPGLSLAWGLWEKDGSGMTAHLATSDLHRMKRMGVSALSTDEGLALFDEAITQATSLLIPAKLDTSISHPLLRNTTQKVEQKKKTPSHSWITQLKQKPTSDRPTWLMEQLKEEIAAVLSLNSTETIKGDRPLIDLGLDSLMAVELRNRLGALMETQLPTSLVFDYPTPGEMAAFLNEQLQPQEQFEEEEQIPAETIPEETEDLDVLLAMAYDDVDLDALDADALIAMAFDEPETNADLYE